MRTYQDAKLTIFGRIDTTHVPKYARKNSVAHENEHDKKNSAEPSAIPESPADIIRT